MATRFCTTPRWEQKKGARPFFSTALLISAGLLLSPAALACDSDCLEAIGSRYLDAYVAHDSEAIFIADGVRFTENNIELPFPDGTWDTVREEPGPRQFLSDPVTGQVGIFTSIWQNDIPGFLAVRLRVEDEQITEIEHIISTRRNLSSPPTPIGEIEAYRHEPVIDEVIPEAERLPREELIRIADGYFQTLQNNTGEIRNTCFHPEATRRENGMVFNEIEEGFKSGRYRFNNRVRRDHILVDEQRGAVLARGFIDHKGQLVEYELTNGTPHEAVFREPQTWGLLEMFKIQEGCISAVVATFYQAPYYSPSPWMP